MVFFISSFFWGWEPKFFFIVFRAFVQFALVRWHTGQHRHGQLIDSAQLCLLDRSTSFLRVSGSATRLSWCWDFLCREVRSIGNFVGYSLAVDIAGATMSLAHSSNLGRSCNVPIFGCSLLTGIDACIRRVDLAGMVCLLSVLMVIGLGLHFCISSVSAIVIWIFGKSIVPCAVSSTAVCFGRSANPMMEKDIWVTMMKLSSKV